MCWWGVGSAAEASDLAIVDCDVPRLILNGKKTTARLTLKAAVPPGSSCVVKALAGEGEIGALEFTSSNKKEPSILLDLTLNQVGNQVIRFSVESSIDDANPANNSISVPVFVLPSKPHVLIITPFMRWDMIYLSKALESLPCRVDWIVSRGNKRKIARGPGKGKIPRDIQPMRKYDLIVLDGTPFKGFTQSDAALLAEFIRREGRALLLSSQHATEGRNTYLTALAKALNIDSAIQHKKSASPLRPGLKMPARAPFIPPVMLSHDAGLSRTTWASLSPPRIQVPVPRQLIQLLENAEGETLLSLGFYGKGKVYIVGIGDMFRTREWSGAEHADRFLRSLQSLTMPVPLWREWRRTCRPVPAFAAC